MTNQSNHRRLAGGIVLATIATITTPIGARCQGQERTPVRVLEMPERFEGSCLGSCVSVAGRRVIVGALDGDSRSLVAAIDRRDGTPRWSTRLGGSRDYFSATMILGRRVFHLAGADRLDASTELAALDVRTGNRLWSRDFRDVDGRRPGIFGRRNAVVAAVPVRDPRGASHLGVTVASHHGATGRLQWETTVGAWAEPRGIHLSRAVRRGRMLFLAGKEEVLLEEGGRKSHAIVLAIDMRDGTRLWEKRFGPSEFPGDPERRSATIGAAAVQGRTLVVAGSSYTDAGRTHFVTAYDSRSGDTLWRSEHADEDGLNERVSLVALGRASVFVVGQQRPEYSQTKLSVYDRRTGALHGVRIVDLRTRSAVVTRDGTVVLAGTLWRTRIQPAHGEPVGLIAAFKSSPDLTPAWHARTTREIEDLLLRKTSLYARSNHDVVVFAP